MRAFISLTLIVLVLNGHFLEHNLKLRKTNEVIDFETVINEAKKYFEKGMDLYLQYCKKTTEYFEAREYEQFFTNIIQALQSLKNYLSKYNFTQLSQIFIDYFEKCKVWLHDFNLDYFVDLVKTDIDNQRAFFASNYFDETLENFIYELRRGLMGIRFYKFEEDIYEDYAKFLRELDRADIKKAIENFGKEFQREVQKFDEKEFIKLIEEIKNAFQKALKKLMRNLDLTEDMYSDKIKELKDEIRTKVNIDDEMKRNIKEVFNNFKNKVLPLIDINAILKITRFVLERYVSNLKRENLKLYFELIKNWISYFKGYISDEYYQYLMQYYDKIYEKSQEIADSINIDSIMSQIENFLNKVKQFFTNTDESQFMADIENSFKTIKDYILQYDFNTKFQEYFGYVKRMVNVIYQFNFGFVTSIVTLIFKMAQALYESIPRVYNSNNFVIYDDNFFS
jgi:hypothetical protein